MMIYADTRTRTIASRISSFETKNPAYVIGIADGGAYLCVENEGVYFAGFSDGTVKKIYGYPAGGFAEFTSWVSSILDPVI